ncbi:GNAT family N-acetyltransferase [Gordonibacter sp. An230]|uniref:GNAT family N-acetyltransferase n=1 Tax=Gordonibacter sp. An230 TaxID=1965592 RepID=UPI000B39A2FD|nr:GNAT family N-acetyltransferase [Gordonibacter sp. An230]OUO89766.1 GNAT family N-acetyltransferase [Gordonibacter sp. An230]
MTHDAVDLHIRPASKSDADAIARLAEEAGMGVLAPRGTSYVAISEKRIAGFIRIVEAEGNRYVNPIVVDAHARRQGVGRALMEDARARYGTLLLVARGSAVPFYTALGCERVSSERISPALGEDCDTCPDLAVCEPVPMIYR